MAGEAKQRMVMKESVGDKVKGETVPFSFPRPRRAEEEVRASALVYIPSLHDHIHDLLESNKM